ncbi:stage II sporulation protein P [Clostridium sp.]|uniref:stage II sporulation protein P n=1 Tax=Clostridium sp. TaxID=1506 RepID=UPI002FCA03DD
MNYKGRDNKKITKLKKNITAIGTSVVLMGTIIFGTTTEAKALEGKIDTSNIQILESIMKNTIAVFKANIMEEDNSILGYFSQNPLKIFQREVAFLEDTSVKEEFAENEVEEESKIAEEIVINPFNLSDSSISKLEKPTVETVGNPEDNSKKKILIYHSHTTEAYDENETRKMDLTQTVAGVGDELAKEFEKQGFTVIHDKTIHDLDYNSAYAKSRETISKYFEKFGEFDFVVDLHRDAGPAKENVTAKINNENVARLVIVTTTSDPRYKEHMNNINSIFAIAKREYPNLFREKNLHTNLSGRNYYNQDLSNNALLLEVGATSNTLEEAKNSMKYVARVVAELINSKKN